MNRAHHRLFYAKIILQHRHDRSNAVSGTRGVAQYLARPGHIAVIDTQDDRCSAGALSRSTQDNLFRPCPDVSFGFVRINEAPRRLDHYVDT